MTTVLVYLSVKSFYKSVTHFVAFSKDVFVIDIFTTYPPKLEKELSIEYL